MLSTCKVIDSGARFNQPVLIIGQGEVVLGKCNLGVPSSPYFLSGYMYIEAREPGSRVVVEDGVWINNNACIVAERTSIIIREGSLIGPELCVFDSDFHDINPHKRMAGTQKTKPVEIGKNSFLGGRVTVLKGVVIGENSVVAAGCVVVRSVPANSIVRGNPGRVVGEC